MDSIINTPREMSLEALAHRSLLEIHRFHRKELSDDRYSLVAHPQYGHQNALTTFVCHVY